MKEKEFLRTAALRAATEYMLYCTKDMEMSLHVANSLVDGLEECVTALCGKVAEPVVASLSQRHGGVN